LVEENPHGVEDLYVFYGLLEDKPMDGKLLVKGLKQACSSIGIDAVSMDIVFHSHRHYYAARMVDRMSADQVSRITGHKSKAVFEVYADHVIEENVDAALAVGMEVFRNIVR
jgi:integrase